MEGRVHSEINSIIRAFTRSIEKNVRVVEPGASKIKLRSAIS
jgi:hypothetical protein